MALAAGDVGAGEGPLRARHLPGEPEAAPTRLADWYLLMARASPGESDRFGLAAYAALENVRVLLPSRDPYTEESTFELHMRPVFEAAADAALPGGAKGDQAAAITKAQQIVEASRQAEIESSFGNECIPRAPPIRPSALRRGEIILYPVLLEHRVELLYAVGGGDDAFHRLAPNSRFNRDDVAAMVDRLRDAARNSFENVDSDDWRTPSRDLYDILIAPLEAKAAFGPRRPW